MNILNLSKQSKKRLYFFINFIYEVADHRIFRKKRVKFEII